MQHFLPHAVFVFSAAVPVLYAVVPAPSAVFVLLCAFVAVLPDLPVSDSALPSADVPVPLLQHALSPLPHAEAAPVSPQAVLLASPAPEAALPPALPEPLSVFPIPVFGLIPALQAPVDVMFLVVLQAPVVAAAVV